MATGDPLTAAVPPVGEPPPLDPCPICLGSLSGDVSLYDGTQDTLKPGECQHVFHSDCILNAINSGVSFDMNHKKPKCPVCKVAFDKCTIWSPTSVKEQYLRVAICDVKSNDNATVPSSTTNLDAERGAGAESLLLGLMYQVMILTNSLEKEKGKRKRAESKLDEALNVLNETKRVKNSATPYHIDESIKMIL